MSNHEGDVGATTDLNNILTQLAAGMASFLSEPIPEGKLNRMLSKHFSSEIQRGIITRGLDTFETVDEYLRDIDETYAEDVATALRQARPPGDNGNGMRRQARERDVAREDRYLGHGFDGGRDGAGSQRVNRDQRPRSGETNDFRDKEHRNVRNENDNNWRRGEASDAQAADLRNRVRYITKFNEDVDALVSSDSDTENEDTDVFSPLIQINVLNHQVIALVDSGSEISAISEVFYNRISCDKQIPTIPTTNVSIGSAVGGKRQRVKVQVLLPIVVEKVKFTCDVQCTVIPNLNCDFLLGCDWLHGVQDHDKQSLEQIWVHAHDRLRPKYKRRAEKHAQHTHSVILNSSALDKVTKKFFLLYEGPHTVSKQAGPNSYELTDGQGNVLPKQNIINLKLYKDPDLRLDE
nr:unnamed protein product [Callosobruchus analis]